MDIWHSRRVSLIFNEDGRLARRVATIELIITDIWHACTLYACLYVHSPFLLPFPSLPHGLSTLIRTMIS